MCPCTLELPAKTTLQWSLNVSLYFKITWQNFLVTTIKRASILYYYSIDNQTCPYSF